MLPIRNLACEYRDLARLRALSTKHQPAHCFCTDQRPSPQPSGTPMRVCSTQHILHLSAYLDMSSSGRSFPFIPRLCLRAHVPLARGTSGAVRPSEVELAPAERAAPPHPQHGCAAAQGGGCLTVPYSTGDHLPSGQLLCKPFEALFEGKLSPDPHEGMGMRVEPSLSRRAKLP